MLQTSDLIIPDWPAPECIKSFFTTRSGGVSSPPYSSMNLGMHVGDAVASVVENRRRLRELLPAEPAWLNQVHGVNVLSIEPSDTCGSAAVTADASVTSHTNLPCAVLVADCLPVLFCANDGSRVAAAHAGWRGLHAGVLERTVESMRINPASIVVWLGPAIGPSAFEVGQEVLDAFAAVADEDASAFSPLAGRPGKFIADIHALARARLYRAGIQAIFGGECCTVSEPQQFFSYRRDGVTGRMAALIWRE